MLVGIRIRYTDKAQHLPLKITTWDALGYYMYLPAWYIYHDEKELKWFPAIDQQYGLSGGEFYQATQQKNGHYVFKYLGGVSWLQLPFFALAHGYALHSSYPADGFSLPYQLAVAIACLTYIIFSLFLLRRILLRYFDDTTTAITLLLLTLASNFVQYVSVDSAQSHGFIFPLYVLVLWTTIRWYEKPQAVFAWLTGIIIGLACICRPTEGVMLLIPLCWQSHMNQSFREKILFLKANRLHILYAMAGLFIGVLPQLLYWKRVTGSWVFDVGSKWDFLSPHFRVLIGWEKGWLIYTPVSILFLAGLFLMRNTTFGKAIRVFCLINIYIIISWHIWRYGASYSCRALVQSYPVFAFPLAAIVHYARHKVWRLLFYVLCLLLLGLNAFQIKQYNDNILHYDEMNFRYYRAIFLKAHPDALDMSLLDTEDFVCDEHLFKQQQIALEKSDCLMSCGDTLWSGIVQAAEKTHEQYLRVELDCHNAINTWQAFIQCTVRQGETLLQKQFRLFNAVADKSAEKHYAFYIRLPERSLPLSVDLRLKGNEAFSAIFTRLQIVQLTR